jgi:hypothetical protein
MNKEKPILVKHGMYCSGNKPKTNFDMITESPEKLAAFILEIQEDTKSGQVWGTVEGCVGYLNEKAGE